MFGAGCFWGVQYNFDQVQGVTETEVGYAGGSTGSPQAGPTYKEVCTGKTGHAEAVHLRYNENAVTYNQLLTNFWEMHVDEKFEARFDKVDERLSKMDITLKTVLDVVLECVKEVSFAAKLQNFEIENRQIEEE